MQLTPDEAAELHTELRLAFDILMKVERALRFQQIPGGFRERDSKTIAYADFLKKPIDAIAKVTDAVGGARTR